MTPLAQETCEPCDSKAPPLPESEIPRYLEEVPDWRLERGGDGVPRIRRSFSFDNFHDAARFAEKLGEICDRVNHHPVITLEYGKAAIAWWSHNIKGLHKNDFIMAAKTDALFKDPTHSWKK
ncbi:MAG: 4a-hydroxytetrahydrobiopterin dehydratase [Elusimicrobiota bacterium]